MQEDIDALHHNQTWELVPKTAGLNIVSSKWVLNLNLRQMAQYKWVFESELKVNGIIDTFKERLAARGFSQLEEVDFEETFSPVVKATTIRIVHSWQSTQYGRSDS